MKTPIALRKNHAREIPAIERYTSRRIQWVNKRAQRHGEAFHKW